MKPIHARRLLKLAAHMTRVAKREFEICEWSKETRPNPNWTGPRSACGTVCCVLGHACHVPAFRRAGLKLDDGRRVVYEDEIVARANPVFRPATKGEKARVREVMAADPYYTYAVRPRTLETFAAGAAFFGLTRAEAEELFTSGAYPLDAKGDVSPRAVAKVLRRFVRDKVGAATYRKLARRKKAAAA